MIPSKLDKVKKRTKEQKCISLDFFLTQLNEHYPEEICHLFWRKEQPWTLLFAVILSAQCTDARVNLVTPQLFTSFPDLPSFGYCDLSDLEDALKTLSFFRAKAKYLQTAAKQLLDSYNSTLPNTLNELTKLAGVGRKTANVVLWNIFALNEGFVVDTHVARITSRLGFTSARTPEKIEQDLMQKIPQANWGQTAQQLVQFGRDFCQARKPKCSECFLNPQCPKVKL